jgi:hypothetical protein
MILHASAECHYDGYHSIMLSAVILGIIMLGVVMLVRYAGFGRPSAFMLGVIMLSAVMLCRCDVCCYAKCRYRGCR